MISKRRGVCDGWNNPTPAFFHPYRPDRTARRDCRVEAEMETGGGLLRPLDGMCSYTQGFRVRNDLRILG